MPRRTRGLAQRSAKREALYRTDRRPLVKRLLSERPVCEWATCWAASVDCHEIKSRARGGSITDERNIACLCRPHHDLITQNPNLAEAAGFSIPSWEDAA